MIEEGIGVGGEGTVNLDLKELDTSALGYIETGGAGVGVSSDLVHRKGDNVDVGRKIMRLITVVKIVKFQNIQDS